jgi:hypothetical protein
MAHDGAHTARARLVIAGIGLVSLSVVAITNVPPGWLSTSLASVDQTSAEEELPPLPATVTLGALGAPKSGRVKTKCRECGIVDSVRRVALTEIAPASYEVTVRMRDGATRVVSAASHGNWRLRERITLIGGENQPGR